MRKTLRAFSIAASFALPFDCTLCVTPRVGNRLYYLLAQFTRLGERDSTSTELTGPLGTEDLLLCASGYNRFYPQRAGGNFSAGPL